MDADREMARELVLGARGMRRAGRQVDRVAGRDLDVERRPRSFARRRVQLPALAAERLQDEDVVRVLMEVEALRAGRGDVGVDLARMPEGELEASAEPRDGLGPSVQALEHDRRAVLDERSHTRGVRDPLHRSRSRAARARVRGLGDPLARLHEAEERRPERRRRQEPVDVVEREQVLEPARLSAEADRRPRPPVVLEERPGVAGAPLERRAIGPDAFERALAHDVPSVPSVSPPSVPSASVPSVPS